MPIPPFTDALMDERAKMTLRELAYFVTGGCAGVFFLPVAIFAYAACAQSSRISRQ